MARFPTTDELIAEFAAAPIEERTEWAVMVDHPGRADLMRLHMADARMYPQGESHDERIVAIERAELHRFVDALAESDLHAMYRLAAELIRSPVTQRVYDSVKRRNDEEIAQYRAEHPELCRKTRKRAKASSRDMPRVFERFIKTLDL